jgi:hypothetical protein
MPLKLPDFNLKQIIYVGVQIGVPSARMSSSAVCTKRIMVDAHHHMLGRLSSIIAKELLNNQKVVVVRCEEICMSGGLIRQGVVCQSVQPDGRKIIRDLALGLWVTMRTTRA